MLRDWILLIGKYLGMYAVMSLVGALIFGTPLLLMTFLGPANGVLVTIIIAAVFYEMSR